MKIKVQISEEELFNIMKGAKFNWENIPHSRDKEIRVDLEIYGEGKETLWKELFDEHPAGDIYKYGDIEQV